MDFTAQLDRFASALIRRLAVFQHDSLFGDEEYNRLALELFALQFEANHAYRVFCQGRGIRPDRITRWEEIPAAPTAGFKEFELSCLAPDARTAVFHSSGTSEQRPSRHYHNHSSLRVYEASLRPWFHAHLLPDVTRQHQSRNLTFLFLTPPPLEVPHSSLVHMFETIRREWGASDSVFLGKVSEDWGWDVELERVASALDDIAGSTKPIALLGTAFGFVHLLDYLAEQGIRIELPAGSRVLETGGYKGRSRAVPKAELHALINERLGVDRSHLVSEYGMSELSSQAYDVAICTCTGTGSDNARVFRFPPWARVQVVSPEDSREVDEGQTGLIRVIDLANVYSTMAIQTEDLAIRRGNGYELLGRAPAAEPRGCSLMATS